MAEYLMTGQTSEIERLQLQSRVWEPAGEHLLALLGPAPAGAPSTWAAGAWAGCGCSAAGPPAGRWSAPTSTRA